MATYYEVTFFENGVKRTISNISIGGVSIPLGKKSLVQSRMKPGINWSEDKLIAAYVVLQSHPNATRIEVISFVSGSTQNQEVNPAAAVLAMIGFFIAVLLAPIVLGLGMYGKFLLKSSFENVIDITKFRKFRTIYIIIGSILYAGFVAFFIVAVVLLSNGTNKELLSPALTTWFVGDLVYTVLAYIIGHLIYKKYYNNPRYNLALKKKKATPAPQGTAAPAAKVVVAQPASAPKSVDKINTVYFKGENTIDFTIKIEAVAELLANDVKSAPLFKHSGGHFEYGNGNTIPPALAIVDIGTNFLNFSTKGPASQVLKTVKEEIKDLIDNYAINHPEPEPEPEIVEEPVQPEPEVVEEPVKLEPEPVVEEEKPAPTPMPVEEPVKEEPKPDPVTKEENKSQASSEKNYDEIFEKLEKAKKLLDENILTQEEFDKIKKDLLK